MGEGHPAVWEPHVPRWGDPNQPGGSPPLQTLPPPRDVISLHFTLESRKATS